MLCSVKTWNCRKIRAGPERKLKHNVTPGGQKHVIFKNPTFVAPLEASKRETVEKSTFHLQHKIKKNRFWEYDFSRIYTPKGFKT
jgi:hypothetical protein